MRYALSDILSALPHSIDCLSVLDRVNRWCGVPANETPDPTVTYSWGEVYDAMVQLGYVADGKGMWRK